jgi:short-subunit dehydrogenase involved in D-alanine esterification of teichoic acids
VKRRRRFTVIYSATKAALHSFTPSLRHQLSETSIQAELDQMFTRMNQPVH